MRVRGSCAERLTVSGLQLAAENYHPPFFRVSIDLQGLVVDERC